MSARADMSSWPFGVAGGGLDVLGPFGTHVALGDPARQLPLVVIMSRAARRRGDWLLVF
jgi:hypothetical protein